MTSHHHGQYDTVALQLRDGSQRRIHTCVENAAEDLLQTPQVLLQCATGAVHLYHGYADKSHPQKLLLQSAAGIWWAQSAWPKTRLPCTFILHEPRRCLAELLRGAVAIAGMSCMADSRNPCTYG